jgi:hypothetical protein
LYQGPSCAVEGAAACCAVQVDYLRELGINAVELLPVFEYDELEFQRWRNPRDHMVNVWGYSHMSFMAPMSRSELQYLLPFQSDKHGCVCMRILYINVYIYVCVYANTHMPIAMPA